MSSLVCTVVRARSLSQFRHEGQYPTNQLLKTDKSLLHIVKREHAKATIGLCICLVKI